MRGEMAVLDHTGDSKTIWDSEKPDEVEAAKRQFEFLTKKGYAAFGVDKKGNKDELVKEFDAEAEKLIFVPPMTGG